MKQKPNIEKTYSMETCLIHTNHVVETTIKFY